MLALASKDGPATSARLGSALAFTCAAASTPPPSAVPPTQQVRGIPALSAPVAPAGRPSSLSPSSFPSWWRHLTTTSGLAMPVNAAVRARAYGTTANTALPAGAGRMDWRITKGSPLPVQPPARRHLMTSEPVRDPLADHLLTPQDCALVIIDYQPVQVRSVRSMDPGLLVNRVMHLARVGMLSRLPWCCPRSTSAPDATSPPSGRFRMSCWGSGPGPDHHQRLGRRRVQAGGPGSRPPQADHGRAVDRGLPDLPLAGCHA